MTLTTSEQDSQLSVTTKTKRYLLTIFTHLAARYVHSIYMRAVCSFSFYFKHYSKSILSVSDPHSLDHCGYLSVAPN